MFKNEKREAVAKFKEELKQSHVVLLLEHGKLTFDAFDKARRDAKAGTKIMKIKNNLAKVAFEGTNYSALNKDIANERLLILSNDLFKACQSAKFLLDVSENSVKIKSGASANDQYEASTIIALSNIESKEQLQSSLLRAIKVVGENMLRVIKAKCDAQGGTSCDTGSKATDSSADNAESGTETSTAQESAAENGAAGEETQA